MDAIVELAVGLAIFVAEITVLAAVGLVTLLRFACSPTYRRKRTDEWAAAPGKKWSDIGWSVVWVAVILACAYFWFAVFRGN